MLTMINGRVHEFERESKEEYVRGFGRKKEK